MKSLGVCVAFFMGLGSFPALAASAFDIAQATPAAPAATPPPLAAAPEPAPAAPAAGTPSKPKLKATAKAKPTAAKKVPTVIRVENKRTVTLKSLQIALSGGEGKVVGKLAKAIP